MAPKKMDKKDGYTDDAVPAEDTSCDAVIATIIQQMEDLNVNEIEKNKMESLVGATKSLAKKWNNRGKKSKEEREQDRIAKAKARAEEKKVEGKRLREEYINLNFTDGDKTYQLRVMRGSTVGTVRMMLGQLMGYGRTKAMRIKMYYRVTCLTTSPRATLTKFQLPDGAEITFSAGATGSGDVPDDASEVTQDAIDTMLARDLDEIDTEEENDEEETEDDDPVFGDD